MGNLFCSPLQEESPKEQTLLSSPQEYLSYKSRALDLAEDDTDDESSDLDDFKTVMSRRTMQSEVWHDAFMEHDDWMGEEIFEVSDEELETIKRHLRSSFPTDANYMGDAYIKSVASKPYSKNMTIRRPLEYSLEKLVNVLEWRKQNNIPELQRWMDLAREFDGSNDDVDLRDWQLIQKLVTELDTASMYLHGHTKDGRPILWVRCDRMLRWPDVDAKIQALALLFDAAIRHGMPFGVTDISLHINTIPHHHIPNVVFA